MPESVLFLDPGLPQTAARPGFFCAPSYPFSREEAASVLAELLHIGESLDLAEHTGRQAARVTDAAAFSGALSAGEEAALRRFAAESAAEAPGKGAGAQNPLIAVQKALLLAWDLEERLLSIEALRREVAGAAIPLAEALADPSAALGADKGVNGTAGADQSFALPGILKDTLQGLPENALPDWRLNLAAIAAFLPETVLLVTGNREMRAALLEAGMLLPLPEDAAQALAGWPEERKAACLWTKTPLWRILGRTRAPERSPWLLASPEIVVCPPDGAGEGKE
jgi:hypothetical protein